MNKENSQMLYTAIISIGLIILILSVFVYSIFRDGKQEIQQEISVILYDAGNGGWEALQEGIKRAEEDFSVNVNCVILSKDADAKEQFAAIENEVKNGADGVAIAAVDYEDLYALLLEKALYIPIVAVESGFGKSTIPLISGDNYEMGKRLGEEILKDNFKESELTVAFDTGTVNRDSIEKREQGLRDALEGKAKIIPLRAVMNGEDADVLVALHKEGLQELEEKTKRTFMDTKKYGIGNTTSIVAALEQGRIEKLIFQNEFNMGYLAVERLLGENGDDYHKDRGTIDFYCVSDEELFDTPYEQLLFPIVR